VTFQGKTSTLFLLGKTQDLPGNTGMAITGKIILSQDSTLNFPGFPVNLLQFPGKLPSKSQ